MQVLDRGAQADARGAAQVIYRGAQAAARGTAQFTAAPRRYLCWYPAVARAAARCASQVLDLGAQAVARGAAKLLQQDKKKSSDLQRSRINKTGFICTMAS
jgi:hypothetical protein